MTTSVASTPGELAALRTALREALGIQNCEAIPKQNHSWHSEWTALTSLGIAAFCAPEELGGFDNQLDAAVATATELGAALHGAPYAGLLASTKALAASDDPIAREVLTGVVAGDRLCAYGRVDHSTGVARFVDGGAVADAMLLAEPDGTYLLFTDRTTWSASATPAFDVTRDVADITVDLAAGRRVSADSSVAVLHGLLLAADAAGCVQFALDRTVAYAANRQSFGRAIGGTQAVQHRLVDHAVRARGMSLSVAAAADQLMASTQDARRLTAVAMIGINGAATQILHDLVQLTGAIGFTWEYGLHQYTRRAHVSARLAANPRAAVRMLAEIEGWPSGA